MNKEIKQKWVEALRSGEYKQGKGTLRTNNNLFCCLGVLCDILSPDKWVNNIHVHSMYGITGVLSQEILDITGISWNNPYINLEKVSNREKLKKYVFPLPNEITLSSLNDKGVPFEEIATIIDECF